MVRHPESDIISANRSSEEARLRFSAANRCFSGIIFIFEQPCFRAGARRLRAAVSAILNVVAKICLLLNFETATAVVSNT